MPPVALPKILGKTSQDVLKDTIDDYAAVISHIGPDVDALVDEIVQVRGIDAYHQADKALERVLTSIFTFSPIDTEMHVIKNVRPKPNGIISFAEEMAKNMSKNANLMEKLREFAARVEQLLDPNYEDKFTQLQYVKMELDAIIHVESGMFGRVEAKMFTCPIVDETRVLNRLLTPAMLRKYLRDRECLYFLMGFSFFYDENARAELLSSKRGNKSFTANDTSMKNRRMDKKRQTLDHSEEEELYVPLDLSSIIPESSSKGLGSWVFHLCILDRPLLKYIKNRELTGAEVSRILLRTIRSHQEFYLTRVRKEISRYREEVTSLANRQEGDKAVMKVAKRLRRLKINIRLNYNILKVHHMSGIIGELQHRLQEAQELIEKEKSEKLKERAEKLKERAEKLKERAEKLESKAQMLEERAMRLKLEAKLTKDKNVISQKEQEAQNLIEEARDLRANAKDFYEQSKEILKQIKSE